MDLQILEFLSANQKKFLTPILHVITTLGDKGIIWLILIGLLWIGKKRKVAISTALSLAIMQVANNIVIKNIIKRSRPFDTYTFELIIKAPSGYSFPSGHTSSSFACATAIFLYNKKWGMVAYVFATVMVFPGYIFPSTIPAMYFLVQSLGCYVAWQGIFSFKK